MRSALALAALLALPLAACAADTDDAATTGDDADVKKAQTVTVDEDDSGKTVTMSATGSLVVKLEAKRTAGYSWKVAAVDRTFGHPEESSEAMGPDGIVGGSTMMIFTWKKNPLLRPGGSHKVTLEYKRPWESGPPLRTFEVTVSVK